jgi:hypothetical protein
MIIPKWQFHEPDHPGADFDALAKICDLNMQEFRKNQGEILDIHYFLDLQQDQTVLQNRHLNERVCPWRLPHISP